jgi:hypothetical protein
MTSLARRPWFVITATLVAVAVGVGAYFVAAPFAPAEHRAPELVDAWALGPHDGLSPLDETTESDGADSATEPPTAVVATSEGGPEAVIGAAVAERLAAFDTRILTGDADLTLPGITRSALGLGATDPCAALVVSGAECPAGARATVLDTSWESTLLVRASYQSDCATAPSGTVAAIFEVYTTHPVNLRISYDVGDETRRESTTTSDTARSAWETGGGADWVSHCITLPDVPAGWSDTVLIEATDELGTYTQTEAFVSNVRPAMVPPSWIEPITPSAVMVSIPTKDVSSVRFVAYAVPFGQDAAGCDFDDESDVPIRPLLTVDERFSAAEMEARSYDPNYIERHSAAFIVPEGSTISICAGWVDAHTWSTNVPDHVFSEVLNSPDYAMPVATIDSVAMRPSVTSSGVKVTASTGALDAECGYWQGGFAFDTMPLCDFSTLAARSVVWDTTLVVQAKATAFGSSGVRQYVLPVAPRLCGVGCVLPSPEYYDIPLESRSDLCLGDGCGESHVGTVRLKVEWIEGNDSWADSWTRNGAAAPSALAPVFDRRATVTLGALSADGLTQSAEVRIDADRESSMRLTVNRSFRASGVERVIENAEFLEARTVTIDGLPVGQDFALTVELTDRDGNTSIYSALDTGFLSGVGHRPWVGGTFSTDSIAQQFEVSISMSRTDGRAFAYGNYSLSLGSTVWSTTEGGSGRWSCVDGTASFDLGTPTADGTVRQATQLYLSIELADLRLRDGVAPGCVSAEATNAQVARPTTPRTEGVWLQLSQLQSGLTYTTSIDDLTVVIRVTPSAG